MPARLQNVETRRACNPPPDSATAREAVPVNRRVRRIYVVGEGDVWV